jgi:hypothetical protein
MEHQSEERERLVYKVKLAEQAERYDGIKTLSPLLVTFFYDKMSNKTGQTC